MTEPTHEHLNWAEPDFEVLAYGVEILTVMGDRDALELLLKQLCAGAWLAGAEACVDALNKQSDLRPPEFVQETAKPAGYAGRPTHFGHA